MNVYCLNNVYDQFFCSFPDEQLLKLLTPEDVPEGYKDDKDDE
jgi:hypothetical protein